MEISYRDLIPGDVVQMGDQVAADRDGVWINAFATIGLVVSPDWEGFYRRRIESTPDALPPETAALRVEVGPVLAERLKRLSNSLEQNATLRKELEELQERLNQVCLENHRLRLTKEEIEAISGASLDDMCLEVPLRGTVLRGIVDRLEPQRTESGA